MTIIHVYRVVEEFVVDAESDEPFGEALGLVKEGKIEGRKPGCEFLAVQPSVDEEQN